MSLLSLIVATIATMVLGSIWYGPLFGKTRMREIGLSKNDMGKVSGGEMAGLYLQQTILSFLMVVVLALVMSRLGINTLEDAMITSFLVWLGFIFAPMFTNQLWGEKKGKLVAIHVFYYLVLLKVVALILLFL